MNKILQGFVTPLPTDLGKAGCWKQNNSLARNKLIICIKIESLRGRGGCIFVDHASGYIHVELQTRLNIPKTIDAKRFFEETCFAHGVVPQSYITDEGSSFTSEEIPSLLKRATEAVREALTSTNKTAQDVEGDGNDLSVGEMP